MLLEGHKVQRSHLEQQTQLRASQVARALAAQVSALFSGLDYATRNLASAYEARDMSAFLLAQETLRRTTPSGAILQVAVADSNGKVVYSSLQGTNALAVGIGDREHFQVHKQGAVQGLHVGRPILGRVSQQWSIPLSRALMRNGRFDGVLVVALSPSYLSSFFRDVFGQPNDVVLLLRNDGMYLARSHGEQSVLGTSVPPERQFLTDVSHQYGAYEVVAQVDGVRRYYAWSRTPGFPMVVSAGLDKQAALAPLLPSLKTSLIRNGVATAVLLLGASLIAWLAVQRARGQAQLAERDALLRKLVEQVPGALFQLKRSASGAHSFPFAGAALYQLHGVRFAGSPGDTTDLVPMLHPDDAHRVLHSVQASARYLSPWEQIYRLKLANGTVRWMHGHANPERTPDGGVLWHGYIHDISEERATQEALRESEERVRLTVDAVKDGMWQWDVVEDRLVWDARCQSMLGNGHEKRQGNLQDFYAMVHPRDLERVQTALSSNLERDSEYRQEIRLRTANGGWLWVETRGQVINRDDHGKPLRMLGMHSDINRRVESERLVRALLDQSSAVIFLTSPSRYIVHANDRAIQLFGPLQGQSVRIIHPNQESFERVAGHYPELRIQGWSRSEAQLQLQDGSLRWFDMYGTLLDPEDPEGNVIWTAHDVDDRHRAQTALVTAQQRLLALIDHFPGGVLLDDPKARQIVAANATLFQLLGVDGFSAEKGKGSRAALALLLPLAIREMLLPVDPQAAVQLGTELQFPDGRILEMDQVLLQAQQRSLGRISILRDITESRRRQSVLEQLAATDTLTELPNRRTFMARLTEEFRAVRDGRHPAGAIVMLDIDYFKRINDTYGHAVGDEVLKDLAALMRNSLRITDMPGRLGGEEFAILLPGTEVKQCLALAERLRQSIETHPTQSSAGEIAYTVSFGACVLNMQTRGPDQCLARADEALYHSKRTGRNRVTLWTEEMDKLV
ncbi:diguanylate cyclase [Acidovorax sp. SDU_ACID1]|uniref:diguanylate cyclase n=1 Tax=Acidovorax sp. SDU_ACID1 TaxID=3136632 RepID=UPI00387352A5